MVSANSTFWRDRSVFITGHTGFKGGWLALWLHQLSAKVHGYALAPPTKPSLFEAGRIKSILASDMRSDLANLTALKSAIDKTQPDVIFHLAAQPLVRESYSDPLGTLTSNVMGTAHLLESARAADMVRAIVIITTDKVYENREWAHPYREIDPLGGHDPYSASKAAAELVTASYRTSFFSGNTGHPACIATARAGNVIGGGDWAADRLVPDCLKAFSSNEPVRLRFPNAVRPWQHVLEPLAGYLKLAEQLCGPEGENFARAWNFGPDVNDDATVGQVAEAAAQIWGEDAQVELNPSTEDPHEAGLLRLDSTMARKKLGWKPHWSFKQALSRTVDWHKAWKQGTNMTNFSLSQIREYEGMGQ